MKRLFGAAVAASIVGGIATGLAAYEWLPSPADQAALAAQFSLVTDIFLRLVKMIIAPLVLSTLVAGVAHMEGAAEIGRVGAKTMLWFIVASIASLLLGLAAVELFKPGAGLEIGAGGAVPVASANMSASGLIEEIVPVSVVEAMAKNAILQIVVFSLFLGTAIAAMGPAGRPIAQLAESLSTAMLKVTGYVMLLAPLAIFCALAATLTSNGPGLLLGFARLIGSFYGALAVFWALLGLVSVLVVGRRAGRLWKGTGEAVLLALSTASSEAALPKLMDGLQRFGAAKRVVSFVLPLGYSFNLDGSMLYSVFAFMFIAQAYGVTLTAAQTITLLATLIVTSKGIAGVPRAALVIVAAALETFGLPAEGLVLVLAVDHILDMGRSATNVVGNSVATVVVARWERALGPEQTDAAPAPSSDRETTGGEAVLALTPVSALPAGTGRPGSSPG